MSKWYEVKVTVVRVFAVEVEDDATQELERADAMQVAMDNASGEDIEAEVTGGPYMSGDVLESVMRHADERWPL